MLDEVLGSYLDSVTEREFDAPFMALLRSNGFSDIHFMHGQYEFGKDFIAKRTEDGSEVQYAVNTKAGDLDLDAFRAVRGQLDDLRQIAVGHPNFDAALPRRALIVITGRLRGAAATTAQSYREYLLSIGETGFEVWDRERLIEFMRETPDVGLAGEAESDLLGLISAVDNRLVDRQGLELFTRRWTDLSSRRDLPRRAAVQAGVIANRLRRVERDDLAAFIGLCLVRAAWASSGQGLPVDTTSAMTAAVGRRIFVAYGETIWLKCNETTLEPRGLLTQQQNQFFHLAYPVTALSLVEILGLLALAEDEQIERRGDIDGFLARFVDSQPGSWHPISDRWAVAVIPASIRLFRTDRAAAEAYLARLASWVADRYELDKPGLAGPNSSVADEAVMYFAGGGPARQIRRQSSYLATVVLDLLSVFEMADTYEAAFNDFRYADIRPEMIESGDDESQYVKSEESYRTIPRYEERWDPIDGWKQSDHQRRMPSSYYLGRINRLWDHLAVSAVLRDRHFPSTLRQISSQPS